LAVVVLAGVFLVSGNALYAGETPQGDSVRGVTVRKEGGAAGGASAITAANGATKLERYRVFSLRHITSDKARDYLGQLEIGTVSKIPGANMILVTAGPNDLLKATAIIGVVDSEQQYTIKQLTAVAVAKDLPTNDRIQSQLSNIQIGTFYDPPVSRKKTRAIIDIHNNWVVAIAPVEVQDKIAAVVKQLRSSGDSGTVETAVAALDHGPEQPKEMLKTEPPVKKEVEATAVSKAAEQPTEGEGNNSSRLFDSLLRSLDEAEQKMGAPGEPNEANVPETVNVPKTGEGPVVTQPDAAAMLAKIKALEAMMKSRPAPNDMDIEKVGVNVTAPAEVNEVNEPVRRVHSTPADIPNANEVLKLNIPEKIPIALFLRLVGENLGFDFLYDPAEVKGNITITLRGKLQGTMTVGDLYNLLEEVLKFYGYVMTRRGSLATIRKADSVEVLDPVIIGDGEAKVQVGDVIVKRVFHLKYIDTASAKNLLEGMKLGLNITEIAQSKTLLVTGYGYRMDRVQQLLDMIDKPGEAKQFRFRKLNFTTAEILVPKLQTLVEQLGEISITVAKPTATSKPGPISRRERITGRGRPTTKKPTPPSRIPTALQAKAAGEGVYLDFDERTNRILMIGFEEDLKTVNELIDTLDVEKQDLRTIRVYQIQYVDAEEVRNKLEELGIIGASQTTTRTGRGRGRITGTGATRSRTLPGGGKPPTGSTATSGSAMSATAEGPLVQEPQVVIIESTNSLLVNATDEQHTQIAMIIGYVDSETQVTSIPYVVYPLENQDPENLATTLNKLIQETTTNKDKAGKVVSTQVQSKTEDQITIIPDKNTFSIIVYGTKKNQQWVAQLIEQLDKRRPQVLIDVTLVQITKDDAFSFDLKLLSSIPDMAYPSGQIAGVDSGIFDLLMATPDRNKFIDMGSSKGEFTGFYSDKKVNALLTAMQTKSYGRVMARPKLLVNDNETGSIRTTDTTYIERKSSNTISGGAGEPVISQQTTFDDYSAGVTMEITPHISEGDMLRLEITLNRSGFTSPITATITKPPDKADADVTTVVTVPDKSTIILGGLEKISDNKGGTKIPILGDLPFIGAAFRTVERSESHDKLYIFVKAHILRPGGASGLADLKTVSESNRSTFERLENEMGNYQDWPGIKSAPMDPVKVLDVD